MPSRIRSAVIGQTTKMEKMPKGAFTTTQVHFSNQLSIQVPHVENEKSQASLLPEQSVPSNSNVQNRSIKELQVLTKRTGAILGNSLGIDAVTEHINFARGGKLIHNGLVKKEYEVSHQQTASEFLRITKTEFSKM
jgi:hypothetical protein